MRGAFAFIASGLLLVTVGAIPVRGETYINSLAGALSPELRAIRREIKDIESQLAATPALTPTPPGEAWGFHSLPLTRSNQHVEILIELQRPEPIDGIALVPLHFTVAGHATEGYGFPGRFRVEALSSGKATVIADYTKEDFDDPGPYPVWIDAKRTAADGIRLVCTKPWRGSEGMGAVALAEIMILSRGRNIAIGSSVRTMPGGAGGPNWAPAKLIDGRTPLGLPIRVKASPSDGYLSQAAETADVHKWVQVDLGSTFSIDEVRLFPARPSIWGEHPNIGFPLRFTITGSETILFDARAEEFPAPAENIISFPVAGALARYVRLDVERIRARYAKRHILALGEIEVWSEGRNVARGKAVTARDAASSTAGPRWNPQFLTDGYDSRGEILPLDEWLRGLSMRGQLTRRLHHLQARHVAKMESVSTTFTHSAIVLTLGGLTAGGLAFWRARRLRTQQLQTLRAQLARDLHDDIGSNLGSIALMSAEARSRCSDETLGEDLESMEKIARETADAMRDMVWLMRAGESTVGDLVIRMRQAAQRILKRVDYAFELQESQDREKLPLEFCRHFLLAFKEALNNVSRHSDAGTATIRVWASRSRLAFEVRDDGRGFQTSHETSGLGLESLRSRANAVGGKFEVSSVPGSGTRIEFVCGEIV